MIPSRTDYVLELEDANLHQLTYMLALPPQYGTARPSRKWLSTQSRATSALPKAVLRPSKLIRRLAVRISESCAAPALPPAAVLCLTHRDLHPWLIRAVFNLLAAEVTMRCDRLKKYQPREGDGVGEGVKGVLGILSSVNALWLEGEHFRALFGEQAGAWASTLHKVQGGCEACILAAVGARGELLAALRANLLGRSRGVEPRLLRVVESWIGWFGEEQTRALLEESDDMAKALKSARQATRRGRMDRETPRDWRLSEGEHHGRKTPGRVSGESARTVPCSPITSEGNESPVREENIADWYARSVLELGSTVAAQSIHPAFQPSWCGVPENDAPEDDAKDPVPKAASTHGGYTSVLDCYGSATDAGVSSGRQTSWVTCTVHTSQAPGHNPPPPDVSIPRLHFDFMNDSDNDGEGPDCEEAPGGEEVPIYACSSIYSGGASPQTPPGIDERLKWRSERGPGTLFRDPFARGGEGKERAASTHVSPSTVPEGWI